jgi:hypothetical protein
MRPAPPLLRKAARREKLLGRGGAGRAARECNDGRRRPLARACPLGARTTDRVADAAARLVCEGTTRSRSAAAPTTATAAATRAAVVAPDDRRIAGRCLRSGVRDRRPRPPVRTGDPRRPRRGACRRRVLPRRASSGGTHRVRTSGRGPQGCGARAILPARRRAAVGRGGHLASARRKRHCGHGKANGSDHPHKLRRPRSSRKGCTGSFHRPPRSRRGTVVMMESSEHRSRGDRAGELGLQVFSGDRNPLGNSTENFSLFKKETNERRCRRTGY